MKKAFFILLSFWLYSCGIITRSEGYKDGRQSYYAKLLSDQEKHLLEQGQEVMKEFEVKDPNGEVITKGTLRVKKEGAIYKSVEVGPWLDHFIDKEDLLPVKGYIEQNDQYDQLGNLMERKVYYWKPKQGEKYLKGEMKGQIEVIAGKEVLVQYTTTYFPDGKVQESFAVVSPSFKEFQRDINKPKYNHGAFNRYNQQGERIQSKTYDYSNKIKT